MKVCVTGGFGFIGQKLLESLNSRDITTRVLTRSVRENMVNREYFVADLLDEHVSLSGFFKEVGVVYHCAGEIKNECNMRALHVEGLAKLLAEVALEIRRTNQPIHWVQLSSVGAYGATPRSHMGQRRIVTEVTACNPVGEYEVTKTIADDLLMTFAVKEPLFTYTILRPSNVIGEAMSNSSFRALLNAIKKRWFFYIGSRSAIATYVYVDDVVSALERCGADLRSRGQVFNLSNDCTLSEIVDAITKEFNVKPITLALPEQPLRLLVRLTSWYRKAPLTQERIDSLMRQTSYPATKIKALLDFEPQSHIPDVAASMVKVL